MDDRESGIEIEIPLYPLYATSFTLYRLSPLYLKNDTEILDNATLAQHATRFHDILKGDVLRGVRVGIDNTADEGLGRAGLLVGCKWTTIGSEDDWQREQILNARRQAMDESNVEEATSLQEGNKGLYLEVEYEKGTYTAILPGRPPGMYSPEDNKGGALYLPLLAIRMPKPLCDVFLDYLSSTFDTRPSPLKLSSDWLMIALESYIDDLISWKDRQRDDLVCISNVRDVQLNLVFPSLASASLRSLDVTIPRNDVPGFLWQGEKIMTASGKPRGDSRRPRNKGEGDKLWLLGPFSTALSQYIAAHLAMPLSPEVQVSKIACGAFVLGMEGRVKIFPSTGDDEGDDESPSSAKAVKGLLTFLLRRAMPDQSTA